MNGSKASRDSGLVVSAMVLDTRRVARHAYQNSRPIQHGRLYGLPEPINRSRIGRTGERTVNERNRDVPNDQEREG